MKAVVLLAAICTARGLARLRLPAARWIVALPARPTLPAPWDLMANPSAGPTLTDARRDWHG